MDIALCSLSNNILKYAGANNPLWIIRNNDILIKKGDKQPIGEFDNLQPFTTRTIVLQPNDTIYIFSDGYVDQFGGEKNKKYGSKRFKQLLLSIQNRSMNDQKEIIEKEITKWMSGSNNDQIDDICVFGVRLLPESLIR